MIFFIVLEVDFGVRIYRGELRYSKLTFIIKMFIFC